MASGEHPSRRRSSSTRRTRETKIATLTFNRPDQLNAPTIGVRLRYADLLHQAQHRRRREGPRDPRRRRRLRHRADLPSSWRRAPRTACSRSSGSRTPTSPTRPSGNFRHGATTRQWFTERGGGCRTLQEFKKITIVEAKGYCYGWHFYQAGDADLVISSDDALFGHAAFRYSAGARGCGGGRRRWACASSRRWSSPAGRSRPRRWPSAASSTAWCRATSSRPRSRSTPWPAPGTGRPTSSSCRRPSSRS